VRRHLAKDPLQKRQRELRQPERVQATSVHPACSGIPGIFKAFPQVREQAQEKGGYAGLPIANVCSQTVAPTGEPIQTLHVRAGNSQGLQAILGLRRAAWPGSGHRCDRFWHAPGVHTSAQLPSAPWREPISPEGSAPARTVRWEARPILWAPALRTPNILKRAHEDRQAILLAGHTAGPQSFRRLPYPVGPLYPAYYTSPCGARS
jgi:hypothetical protein